MGFKERLREARNAAGLSGEKLGEAVGYSKQNVSHWEAGRFEPNIETLKTLCDVLDCSLDWLIMGKAPEPLSAAALKQARYYDSLSPEAQRRWETLKMILMERGASDATIEERMPITKAPAFNYSKKNKEAPHSKMPQPEKAAKKRED